jgi:hypothetical protein
MVEDEYILISQLMRSQLLQEIRNYITQSGVLQPKASSWVHLFQDDDDRNFSYNSWLCQTNFLLLQAILIPEIEIDTRDYLYSLKMRME